MSRRIGIVCPYAFDHHGGVQNHVRWLAGGLAAQGDQVSILAPGSALDPPAGVELISAGSSLPVPYNGSVARVNFGPHTAGRVRRWLRHGRFDLVHLHEPITPSIALHALAAAEVPVVATFHTATPRSRTMTAAGRLLAPLVRKIDAGIAVSESARQVVVQHLGRDAVVLPNGFDAALLQAAARATRPDPWRGGSRPRVTFLGRTDEARKGLDVLLAAVPHLLAARPDLDIVVAGRGRRALPPGVRTLGPISDHDKVALLASTDVFVAPHLARESFGIVLLEALAAGSGVVASALPAFVDLLEPFGPDAATIVGIGDGDGLAAAVLATLDTRSPHPPEHLTDFGWPVLGPKIDLVYRSALAAGPHATGTTGRHRPAHRARQAWPSLEAALLARAGLAAAPPEPGTDREQVESRRSELLRGLTDPEAGEHLQLSLARRLHNDAVATARQARRPPTSDLRSFEMAEV